MEHGIACLCDNCVNNDARILLPVDPPIQPLDLTPDRSELISELAQLITGTDYAYDSGVTACLRVVARWSGAE